MNIRDLIREQVKGKRSGGNKRGFVTLAMMGPKDVPNPGPEPRKVFKKEIRKGNIKLRKPY